jgi:hypothetical protein
MMASVHYIVVNECISVWVPGYCEYTHLALLLVVDDRLNEAIPLSCVIGDMDRVKHEVQVKVRRETRLSSATAARKVK